MGLNRTSVGLKLISISHLLVQDGMPQSNQRGIETSGATVVGALLYSPQSNQRGIETNNLEDLLYRLTSLNRTSVGLKQYSLKISLFGGKAASIEPAWD